MVHISAENLFSTLPTPTADISHDICVGMNSCLLQNG